MSDAATEWVCSPHGTRIVQDEEPRGSCVEADRSLCTWQKVKGSSPATQCLNEHLATTALGGNHPLMVVVRRDALKAMLAELDLLREREDDRAE